VVPPSIPFYTASLREFSAAGREIVGSAPVGYEGTATWLERSARACGVGAERIAAAQQDPAGHQAALAQSPIRDASRCRAMKDRSFLVAGCWSKAGPTCDTPDGLSAHRMVGSGPAYGSSPKVCALQYRRHSSRISPPCTSSSPIWRSAPRPWCKRPRKWPSRPCYFTNLISARPLMGRAGAGSLAQVLNAALGSQSRFDEMKEFFEVSYRPHGGHLAGFAQDHPLFRSATRRSSPARSEAQSEEWA